MNQTQGTNPKNTEERLLTTLRRKRSRYLLLMVSTFFMVIALFFAVAAFLYLSIGSQHAPEISWYQVSTSALEILYMYAFSSALFGILFIIQLKMRIRVCRAMIYAIKRRERVISFKSPRSLLSFFYLKRISEEFMMHLGVRIGIIYRSTTSEDRLFKLANLFQERFGIHSLKRLKRMRNLSLFITTLLSLLYLTISFSNPLLLFLSQRLASLLRLLLFLIIILLGVYSLGSFSLQRWALSCLNWDEIRMSHGVEFKEGDFMPALSERYGFFGSAFFFPLHFFYDNNLSFEMNFLSGGESYEKVLINLN